MKYSACVQFCLKNAFTPILFFVVVNQEWTLDFSNAFLTSIEIIIFLPKCINVMNLTTKMEGISYY